jgi:hypothetical protein
VELSDVVLTHFSQLAEGNLHVLVTISSRARTPKRSASVSSAKNTGKWR